MKYVSVVKMQLVKESRVLFDAKVSSPAVVAKMIKQMTDGSDRELVYVVSVDSKNKPIATELVSMGGVNSSIIDVGNIFKHALLSNAAGVIIAHNHPSGDVTPSLEDIRVTKKIEEAGKLLNLPLLDHVVVGDMETDVYYSFLENGRLVK